MNVYCPTCQRQHEVRRPQAYKVGPERVTAAEVVVLVLFILFMYAAIIYALPIVLTAWLT